MFPYDGEDPNPLAHAEKTGDKMARRLIESGFWPKLRSLRLFECVRSSGFKVHLKYDAEFVDQPPRVIEVTVDVVLGKAELAENILESMPNRAAIQRFVVDKLWG
ncbi:MAG: hypothetical protein HY619_07570 [Thaumarchaeota archaeon]|nr:hypothetical protein [Nitrososphaerota archaeon]